MMGFNDPATLYKVGVISAGSVQHSTQVNLGEITLQHALFQMG